MKNHELLDMIGEANEDYVLAADQNVVRPRFGWKTLAACAACAALIAAAYPVYRSFNPPLHQYALMEGGIVDTLGGEKAPADAGGFEPAPNPEGDEAVKQDVDGVPEIPVSEPAQPARGDGPSSIHGGADVGSDNEDTGIDGTYYYHIIPGQDAPAQEYAIDQYDKLFRGMGMYGEGAASYPGWFAGAWIDWETLHVAIVDGLRTPELEAEIAGWCGSGVVFEGAKYSHNFLDGLMDPVTGALDGTGLACGIGVDVSANCLGVDVYSDGAAVPDSVLAKLAKLDPAGDAIRVRVFTQAMSTLTDEVKKGPAYDLPAPDPVDPEARATPVDGSEPAPGGKTEPGAVQEGGAREAAQPAAYDLPEPKEAAGPTPDPAGYDIIYGAED